MAETVYNQLKHRVMSGTLDLDASDIRAVLVGVNKTGVNNPDLDFLSEIDALNAGATTLNANRVALTTKTVALVDASDWAQANADTITFPAEAFIALGIIFFLNVGTDATNVLLSWSDTGFGAGVDLTSGGMTYSLPNGWLRGT